jgi:hypothetical protein
MVNMSTEKRSAKLEAALEARQGRRAELLETIEGLRSAEDAGLRVAMRTRPDRSAYTMGGAAQTARQRREKAERELEGVEKELLALTAELEAAGSQEAAERLEAHGKDLQRIARDERRHVEQAGQLIEELGHTWKAIAALRKERSETQHRVHAEQLREKVRFFHPAAASSYDAVDSTPFAPVSVDFQGFIEQLVEASRTPGESGPLGEALPDLSNLPRLSAGTGTYTPRHKRQGVPAFYRNADGELEPAA